MLIRSELNRLRCRAAGVKDGAGRAMSVYCLFPTPAHPLKHLPESRNRAGAGLSASLLTNYVQPGSRAACRIVMTTKWPVIHFVDRFRGNIFHCGRINDLLKGEMLGFETPLYRMCFRCKVFFYMVLHTHSRVIYILF